MSSTKLPTNAVGLCAGRHDLRTAIRTNYVDADLVLALYEEIMAHEEELLLHLMMGGEV